MAYLEITDIAYGYFDTEALNSRGLELRETYNDAVPFPHIVLDDFLPASMLEACLEEFPCSADPDSAYFDRAQERYKRSYNPEYLSPRIRAFFYSLNSRPFLCFLENLTGVRGLIPDPYFVGGGFHQTSQGGHLSIHADFNHHKPLNLERRLNVLIYLNKNWPIQYGGALELWDESMEHCVKKIAPEFGRCVVFSTNAKSYHGHPDPVAHPQGAPRRSIALYYYTATWDETARARTTQFRSRKGTSDAPDWIIKRNEILNDVLPPVLLRGARGIARRLRGAPSKQNGRR